MHICSKSWIKLVSIQLSKLEEYQLLNLYAQYYDRPRWIAPWQPKLKLFACPILFVNKLHQSISTWPARHWGRDKLYDRHFNLLLKKRFFHHIAACNNKLSISLSFQREHKYRRSSGPNSPLREVWIERTTPPIIPQTTTEVVALQQLKHIHTHTHRRTYSYPHKLSQTLSILGCFIDENQHQQTRVQTLPGIH